MRDVALVVALVVAVGSFVTWTAGRLDRLRARVDGAWAALDAQLVRRAAAAAELAAHARRHRLLDDGAAKAMEDAALIAREADRESREGCENDLTRAIGGVVGDSSALRGDKTERLLSDLDVASIRAALARQFYNDAVRDLSRLRRRWLPRLLAVRHRHQPAPGFFEIADPSLTAEELPG